MRVLLPFAAALLAGPAFADPPGLVVAGSEPKAAVATGKIQVLPGRFVPLTVASGKPALLLGNEAALFDVFTVAPGEKVIGIRWDEPAGAKAKRYTFPAGATHIALAGETGGVATLTAIVNGAGEGPPVVAGTLVLEVTGPRPPPIPPGPTPPDPGPTPPPGPVTSFRVIFVTESGTVLTPAQTAVTGAKAVRDYLTAKTTPEGGWAGYRHYDPQTNTSSDQPTMKALWAAVKPKITTVPCLVVETNGKADILPFPANAAEALATLKKYGGN